MVADFAGLALGRIKIRRLRAHNTPGTTACARKIEYQKIVKIAWEIIATSANLIVLHFLMSVRRPSHCGRQQERSEAREDI